MNCSQCGNPLVTGKTYCSHKCYHEHQYDMTISDWKSGKITGTKTGLRIIYQIRRYLMEKYSYSCALCGWNKMNPVTGKTPLEIDHIDGNCKNNVESNLRLLCPCCHSLTPTWKALNKGNGNKERHKYSGLISGS